MLGLLWFILFYTGSADAVDLTSNLVFDPTFYVNTHADLHHLGIDSVSAAKHHWLTNGIKEGRQGCGSFHSKQYLKRYSDLAKMFGNNYQQAIEHYLSHHNDKRLGYVDGGYDGRWTISNHDHDLFISASARMGGAIDSLVWGNKEFINAWDHGRELQMVTNVHPYGECFNPTEAGGRDDGVGPGTKSKIMHVSAQGNVLHTTNHPAFWLHHNDHENHGSKNPACPGGAHALNTVDTYEYDFSKTVTIGCAGLSHCIKYVSNFTIGGKWPAGYKGHNFAAPTGYLTSDFHVIKSLNVQNGQIQAHSTRLPIILITSDNKFAMGVYSPEGQDTDNHFYNGQIFGTTFARGTTKWNSGFRKKPFNGGTHSLIYVTYICVGDLNQVSECLRHVHSSYPKV